MLSERGQYVGPSLLGPIETSSVFKTRVMRYSIGETFTPDVIPDWVRILLNKDTNKKLSVSIGQSDYFFDLRQKNKTLYVTLYDPAKKMSLIQTEFQIERNDSFHYLNKIHEGLLIKIPWYCYENFCTIVLWPYLIDTENFGNTFPSRSAT